MNNLCGPGCRLGSMKFLREYTIPWQSFLQWYFFGDKTIQMLLCSLEEMELPTWISVRLHSSLATSSSLGRQSRGDVVPQVFSKILSSEDFLIFFLNHVYLFLSTRRELSDKR